MNSFQVITSIVILIALIVCGTAAQQNPQHPTLHSSEGGDEGSAASQIRNSNSASNTSDSNPIPTKLKEDANNEISPSSASTSKINTDEDTPLKTECSTHKDCPYNHCCTVGMMRYTFPSCSPLGSIDESCMPNATSRNFTLSYPNLKYIKVKEAYLMFCPCTSNLICDRESATCQLPPLGEESHQHTNEIVE